MAYKNIKRRKDKKVEKEQQNPIVKRVNKHYRATKKQKSTEIEGSVLLKKVQSKSQINIAERIDMPKGVATKLLASYENKKRNYSNICEAEEGIKRFKSNKCAFYDSQKCFKYKKHSNGFVKTGSTNEKPKSFSFNKKINFLGNNSNLIIDTKEMFEKNIKKYGKDNVYVLPSNANVFDYFSYYQSPEYRANPKKCIFSAEDDTPREPTLSQMLFDMDEHCNKVYNLPQNISDETEINVDYSTFLRIDTPKNNLVYDIDDLEKLLNKLQCKGLTENKIESIIEHIEKLNVVGSHKISHLNKIMEPSIDNQINKDKNFRTIEMEDSSSINLEELFNNYHEDDMMLFQ
ncbi:hypothetical protein COBT_000243 [Conglomerata obtusa]